MFTGIIEALGEVAAIEQLQERKLAAIELHYWHDWTLDRIAEHQDRGKSAVAGDIHRGLKLLRKLIREFRALGAWADDAHIAD